MKVYLELADGSSLKSLGRTVPSGTKVRINTPSGTAGQPFKTWKRLQIYGKGVLTDFCEEAMGIDDRVCPSDEAPEKLELV